MSKARRKKAKDQQPFEIYIAGHAGAAGLLADRPDEFDVILYTNSNYPPPRMITKNARDYIHFSVDDVDRERNGFVQPSVSTVINFLEWSQDKDKILSVCHAGVSRSSSTAYVIASAKLGPEESLKFLVPQRHWPNRLIVWIGTLLLKNEDIWNRFVEWQHLHSGMDPEVDFHFPDLDL